MMIEFINSKKNVGKPYFSDEFKNIIKHYIKVGYNLDVMRQSAIMVSSYGFLLNGKTVGQATRSITTLT